MTDADKLKVINAIVSESYESVPLINNKDRGAFYDGVMSSIFAVLQIEESGEEE